MTRSTESTRDSGVDDTNHDLIHALSVRMDVRWHERTYGAETHCQGCQRVFSRLQDLDREALQLLTNELDVHIKENKFPLDLSA